MDPRSGHWVVGYTKFVTKKAAFILLDAIDNCRLCRLSCQTIDFLWKLNRKPILGSDRNIEKLECMLGMIEETDSKRLPRR